MSVNIKPFFFHKPTSKHIFSELKPYKVSVDFTLVLFFSIYLFYRVVDDIWLKIFIYV